VTKLAQNYQLQQYFRQMCSTLCSNFEKELLQSLYFCGNYDTLKTAIATVTYQSRATRSYRQMISYRLYFPTPLAMVTHTDVGKYKQIYRLMPIALFASFAAGSNQSIK
jgi:hypothetical protein